MSRARLPRADLFLGNAGTALRPLTAVLRAWAAITTAGVARMHERPIGDLVDALRQLGARIDTSDSTATRRWRSSGRGAADRSAPLHVRGNVSSQFLTALLMALPLARRAMRRRGRRRADFRPYVEITLRPDGALRRRRRARRRRRFTCRRHAGTRVTGTTSRRRRCVVGVVFSRRRRDRRRDPVRVEGVGRDSIQGDVRFVDALGAWAPVTRGDNWIEGRWRKGRRRPARRPRRSICNAIPDAAMTLAVDGPVRRRPHRLRNIGSWRVKETDRIAAMATELRKFGCRGEGRTVASRRRQVRHWRSPPPIGVRACLRLQLLAYRLTYQLTPTTTTAWRMCFSLGGAGRRAGAHQRSGDAWRKTFPGYFERLARFSAARRHDGRPRRSSRSTGRRRPARARSRSASPRRSAFTILDSGALLPARGARGARRAGGERRRPCTAGRASRVDSTFASRQGGTS